MPFAQKGCQVYGMDLCSTRISQAKIFFQKRGLNPVLRVGDATTCDWGEEHFDLILLHDVIEHVPDKGRLLRKIHDILAPGGIVFVGFPAWQMPFGGHQQIAHGHLSLCPWIHLLPACVYEKILRWGGETDEVVRELLSIKKTHCTIELFQHLVRKNGFQIVQRTLFLINPHYQVKFGLRPVGLPSFLSALPWLRNFYCSGTFYLLKKVN